MNTLHIISAPVNGEGFVNLLNRFAHQDSVIFIQDGCYSLSAKASVKELHSKSVITYAIAGDMIARNINIGSPGTIKTIDYDTFVDLTLSHKKTISW